MMYTIVFLPLSPTTAFSGGSYTTVLLYLEHKKIHKKADQMSNEQNLNETASCMEILIKWTYRKKTLAAIASKNQL